MSHPAPTSEPPATPAVDASSTQVFTPGSTPGSTQRPIQGSMQGSTPEPTSGSAPASWALALPGVALALAVAAVAWLLGRVVPVVGAPVFGIVLGAAVGAVVLHRPSAHARPHLFAPGISVAGKQLLQVAIVVLGSGLSLRQVAQVGGSSLPVMLGTLAVALSGAFLIGRALGIAADTRTLIGVGTGICGASAIAAATSVMKPRDSDVAYAIGTIFTFNIAAVLLFPVAGHAMHLDAQSFGLWAGTAVNDTSSVVASALSFGSGAQQYAVVVKLTRTLMIIPIVMTLAWLHSRRSGGAATRVPWRAVVPPFLVGFVAMAGLNSLGVVPASWHGRLGQVAAFLITTALAAIGLELDARELRRAGVRPLLLGGILWVLVALTSLGLQAATGTL